MSHNKVQTGAEKVRSESACGTNAKHKRRFDETLRSHNVDLLNELLLIVKGNDLTPKQRSDVLLELMAYSFPKRKALEVSGDSEAPVAFHMNLSGK